MGDIALKIDRLHFSEEFSPMIRKFIVSLSDDVVSYEDMNAKLAYLESKGIIIKKPSEIKVLANDMLYLQKTIESYEQLGELDCLIQNPMRINSKEGINRLTYMQSVGDEYKADGKYSSLPFKKRLFENKYGVINFDKDDNKELSSDIQMVNLDSSLVSNMAIDNNWQAKEEPVIESPKVEEEYQNVDPLDEVLSKPKRIAFSDETFEKYNILYENLQHIWVQVYNEEEISDAVIEHLNMLVTNGFTNDFEILFKAITYGKTLPDAEIEVLKNAIYEEIEYNKEIGARVA